MDALGRYRILKEIGRGSMGFIYLGYDPDIGRTVAVKTIRWDQTLMNIAPDEALQRFTQEIKIVGQLQHPNIVTLYDMGESEGIKYFAMEYVEGRTLSKVIQTEGRLALERAIEIIKAVAEGLHYAHSKGVIHRDVKPSNIILSNEGQVKITDFGIARWSTLRRDITHSLTGTPNYISPEQVSGKPVDYRSDIFSLGVLTYELLTGVSPFKGETITQIIHKVMNETPCPPSTINQGISARLDDVVMKALEKTPDKRHADMNVFKDALIAAAQSAFMEKTSVGNLLPSETGSREGHKGIRRFYVAGLIVFAIFALTFLASQYLGLWGPQKREEMGQAYALGFAKARDGDIEEARETFEGLLSNGTQKDKGLVGLAYLNLREGRYGEVMRLSGEALRGNPHNLYAYVLRSHAYFQQNDLDHALEDLSRGLKNASGTNWEASDAYTLLGRIQDLQGKNEEALTSYEKAILLDPTNPVPYTNKGTLLSRMGNYQGAVTSYQDLLKISENPPARLLASEGQRLLSIQADEKKHERITSLIADLNSEVKGKGKEKGYLERDPWSSRPLILSVYPFPEKGSLSLDASAGLFLQARLIQELRADPRFSVVNREILDWILQEMHLSLSKFADREKALQVGRIVGANLMITGTLFHLGGRLQAILQVIEIETTYVKAALSDEQSTTETLIEFSDRLAKALQEAIESAFPLKGRITKVTGEEVLLNLGEDLGAREGMQFRVLPDTKEKGQKKKEYIGTLTVVRIMETASLARVDSRYEDIRVGQRIIEVRRHGAEEEVSAGQGS